MRPSRRPAFALLGLLLAAVIVLTGLVVVGAQARASGPLAPDFTLTDIYGHSFTLSSYRGHDVVVIEFTSLSCSACQIVEKSLSTLYAQYNQSSGGSPVKVISVYIEPSFGDTIPALRTYHDQHNITWTMAQDTPSLAVSTAYAVSDIPVVVVVNEQGYAVYKGTGIQATQAQTTAQIQTAVSGALGGSSPPIAIVTVSVFALAALAGVTTFFSPCAFPMFPGYMSLFLGLNVSATEGPGPARNAGYSGAARRAFSAGSVSALGMMIVFLLIGVALLLASSLVGKYIPDFLIVVGVILIGLGALLLTNLQYWRIVTPIQGLWHRLTGRKTSAEGSGPVLPANGQGLYVKLFGYGMGYAAAASGCVAPVIFAAVVGGLALGTVSGVITILIFSLTAALLMIGVTLALALAGQRYVNQLKAYTPIIKKVSAAALVVVGIYLIYFYYTAWGFPTL